MIERKHRELFQPKTQLQSLYTWGGLEADFSLTEQDKISLERSWQSLQKVLSTNNSDAKVYGIHTHFGAQVNQISTSSPQEHQLLLLEYLRVGVGEPLDDRVVRRALRLQIYKACQGYSGICQETIQALVSLANQKELPPVPCHGSLGASGDLIPMAHAIAPIFEKGVRGPRDVLGLVNTNAMMSSLALEIWWDLYEEFLKVLQVVATTVAAMKTSWEFFLLPQQEPFCHQRPQVAKVCHALEIALRAKGEKPPESPQLQPRYSIRCSPQILGSIWAEMQVAQDWILEEALCVSDNPVIAGDSAWHAGLFYTSSLASSADLVHNCIGKLAEMLDRQILLLMDPQTNGGLSYNLSVEGFSHCKGLHQMVSALNQRLRAMGGPTRKMSFSCESNNQDVVPCSMEGWNIASEMLQIFKQVSRAARFCADRAWNLRHSLPVARLNQWTRSEI